MHFKKHTKHFIVEDKMNFGSFILESFLLDDLLILIQIRHLISKMSLYTKMDQRPKYTRKT